MARRKRLDVTFGAKRVKPEEELESGLPRELRNRPKRRERRLAVKPSLLDYIRTGSEVAQGLRPENIPMTGMRAGQQIIPAIGGGLSALYDYARSTAPGQVVTDVLGAPVRFGEKVRENPAILAELIPGAGTVQGIREGAQRLAEGDPEAMRNAAALAAFAGAMDVIPGGGKGANLAVKGAKELAEEGVDLAAREGVQAVKPTLGFSVYGTRQVAPREVVSAPQITRNFNVFDVNPEIYGLRKTKDLPRLQSSPIGIEHFRVVPQPRKVSLADYEGRPFIISMADRTAAGDRIVRIGDQELNFPVELQGGQDFMFDPTTGGIVWASETSPVSNIMNVARNLYEATGQKPLYLPYRMGGEGSDFATMTGETMMSYADAALGAEDKAAFNSIVEKYIPDFAGISDPKGYEQFASLPGSKRKQIQTELGLAFGEEGGGLTVPMTRAIIADPAQLNRPSFMLQNVGEIDPTRDIVVGTGHHSYSRGVPGQALGTLGEDINAAQLLPELSKIYNIGDPRLFRGQYAEFTDYGKQLKLAEEAAMREQALRLGRTPKVYNVEKGGTNKYMQSGAKFGILTEDLLRRLYGE